MFKDWRFGLAWLLWAVAVCALAARLLMFPPTLYTHYGRLDPTTGRAATEATSWPAEVVVRLGFCVVILLIPAVVGRRQIGWLARILVALSLVVASAIAAIFILVLVAIVVP